MRFCFFDELEGLKCAICGSILNEGYGLEPENAEEYDVLEKKFGDVSKWTVGECCFGGYCGAVPGFTPTRFFKEKIRNLAS